MKRHSNPGNKFLVIKTVSGYVLKGFISAAVFLIILEAALQITGTAYLRLKYTIKNPEALKDDSLRIMFIGDSWTQGADAAPGPGYVMLVTQELNRLYPVKSIQVYNFALGSTNSSQAIHQFLDNYRNIKPDILVVLTGANNGWNTQDIITARKRIRNGIINYNELENTSFAEQSANFFKKLKIAKLYNLISYNIFYKSQEIKIPLPDNEYLLGYHKIFNATRDPEKARLYLINNYKENTTDYNDLYKATRHSFGGDIEKTLNYLKNKNMLKLNLISEKIDIKKDRTSRSLHLKILEENLTDLKDLCDQEGIIMVVENYPYNSMQFRAVNDALGRISSRINAVYVNHYGYFKDKVGYEEWDKVMTKSHVNYKGHEYMADNLVEILSAAIATQERSKKDRENMNSEK
ncbi:MAG: SGNH/GDSL hydrolase family protein [Patescibacteria group bacterium]